MGNMNGSYGSHYTLWQSITTNSQSVTGNYSNVTVNLYLTFDGSSYYAYTSDTTSGSMTIDGVGFNYSIGSISFSSGQSKTITLASWTGNVIHNSDGTRTLSVSGSWNTNTSRIGSGSCSASATLPTIPRASTIASFNGTDIEGNFSVQYNSYSSSFTNKLRISIPNVKELENFTYTSGTTFKLSSSTISYLYTYMANSKTVSIGAVIETYSGSTKIGESSEVVNTCYITNCNPTVSATLTDTNSNTTALTGNNKIMVLNASTGSLVISTTLKKSAGSIKSVTVNGTNVGSSASITKTYTPVTTSTFTIVATDSRGYSTTLTLSPTVKSYTVPTVSASFARPSPTTGQINLQYSGNWFNGSFGSVTNTLTVSYKYKLSTASSYTTGTVTITPTTSGNTYSRSATSLGTDFTYTNAYDFVLTVADKLNTITYSQRVSQGLPIIQWNKTTFQVNGNTNIDGMLYQSGKDVYQRVFTRTMASSSTNLDNPGINGMFELRASEISYTGTKPVNAYGAFLNLKTPDSTTMMQMFAHTNYGLYYRGTQKGNVTLDGIAWAKVRDSRNWGVSLYDNTTGTSGTVTLSETSTNFTYLEIFFKSTDDTSYFSQKVYSPNGKNVEAFINMYGASNYRMHSMDKRYKISGTSITVAQASYVGYYTNGGTPVVNAYDNINIVKVVGYR